MAYIPRSSPLYDKNFKRLTKKNAVLKERTLKKIREILDNPGIGEILTQFHVIRFGAQRLGDHEVKKILIK